MYGGNPIENLSNGINQMALNVAATSIANKDAYKYSTRYADYTNAINLRNWQLQNQRTDWLNRNSALIQKQALRDAGVSPATMTDAEFSGAVSDVGSPAAAMAGHGISAPDLLAYRQQQRQLDIQQQLADAEVALKDAQKENVLANTREIAPNAASTRELQAAEAAYKNGSIPLVGAMQNYYNSLTGINRQQFIYNFYKFDKDLQEIDSRIANNYASADASASQAIKSKIDAWHTWRTSDAVLNNIISSTRKNLADANLSDTQAMEISQMLVPRMMELCAQSDYYDASTGALNVQKLMHKLQSDLIDKYGDAKEIIGMFGDVMDAVAKGTMAASMLSPVGKGAKLGAKAARVITGASAMQ